MSIENFDNGYWVDISGILGIQRAIVNAGNNGVSEVNKQYFTALDNAVNSANNSILPTLAYQKEVLDIVNREKTRLEARKGAIDNAYNGQARMVSLTDSVTAKNQAYNYLLFVVVLIILAYLGIKILKNMEIVPVIVLEIANIIIISVGLIYCIYLYIDIKRRYNMDFNQVVLRDPDAKSQDEINKDMDANVKSGDLLSVAGNKGCQPDHSYNKKYDICVPNAPPVKYNADNTAKVSAEQYPNTARYFAKDDGTFEWKNAASATPAPSATPTSENGCGTLDKYDFELLACKVPETFSNMNLPSSSANAKAFTASEFDNYGKYN